MCETTLEEPEVKEKEEQTRSELSVADLRKLLRAAERKERVARGKGKSKKSGSDTVASDSESDF